MHGMLYSIVVVPCCDMISPTGIPSTTWRSVLYHHSAMQHSPGDSVAAHQPARTACPQMEDLRRDENSYSLDHDFSYIITSQHLGNLFDHRPVRRAKHAACNPSGLVLWRSGNSNCRLNKRVQDLQAKPAPTPKKLSEFQFSVLLTYLGLGKANNFKRPPSEQPPQGPPMELFTGPAAIHILPLHEP